MESINRTISEAEPVLVEMIRIVGKYNFTLHEFKKILEASYMLKAVDRDRGIESVFLLPEAFAKSQRDYKHLLDK